MDLRVSLIGFVVGALIGLTGMGGGTVMTPLMIFLFHMHPTMAVGTDLVYASITKLAGALQHI
ncbi:MAG: sulfite exporter TauE/SafE family protein, partial [Alicyclobacillus sp.]|nr:sulfite exporter TauE/SafE family protein [Alicyclobacillus sp.]